MAPTLQLVHTHRLVAAPPPPSTPGAHHMMSRQSRLSFLLPSLLVTAFALSACQGSGLDGENCQGKCDGLNDGIADGLMPGAPEAPGTISITRNGGQWLCEVIGPKGEIVLLSETYNDRAAALNGALSIEDNGVRDTSFVVRENAGMFSFELRAGNNQSIADSQTFATEVDATAAAVRARTLIAGIVQHRTPLTDGAQFALTREGSAWRFELKSDDGEPVLKSQDYSRRRDSITGIESVRTNGKNAARFELLENPTRFILKAANGVEIAESAESFGSEADALAAIASTSALLSSERVANPW